MIEIEIEIELSLPTPFLPQTCTYRFPAIFCLPSHTYISPSEGIILHLSALLLSMFSFLGGGKVDHQKLQASTFQLANSPGKTTSPLQLFKRKS